MPDTPSILKIGPNDFIAYHKSEGKKNQLGVIFLGGFMSDMTGTKATELEKFCQQKGYSFIRFDYFGHGQSSGKFIDGTISQWKDNIVTVLDELSKGPQILIGSSLGGWLMLLATLARPNRIVGLIGIASAPDFTENLIWEKLKPEEQKELKEKGVFNLASEYNATPYPISMKLIEDGRKNLLLDKKIDIKCPVRLIHGLMDDDVPSDLSIKIGENLTTDNMCVSLVPDGDHRMSTPENIELICSTLEEMVQNLK